MGECLVNSSQCHLQSRALPFDDPNYLFDLKYDGFRALAEIEYELLARVDREELFERDRHKEPVPGWHSCALACAELEEA